MAYVRAKRTINEFALIDGSKPNGGSSTGSQVHSEGEPRSSWTNAIREFAARGFLLCVCLFLVELGLLVAIASIPFFSGERATYTNQAHQLRNQISGMTGPQLWVEIFTNNYRIALLEMIPVFGTFFFGISTYATARVFQAIAGMNGIPAVPLVLLTLFVFPHSYIEISAYAVASAEGLYLLYAIMRWVGGDRGRLRKEAWQLGINFVIVTLLLAIAAAFETVETELGASFLITWLPFVGLVIGALWLNGRLVKIRKSEEARTLGAPASDTYPESPENLGAETQERGKSRPTALKESYARSTHSPQAS